VSTTTDAAKAPAIRVRIDMAPIVLLRGSEVCLCIAEQRMNEVRMSASEGITDIARPR
jgi:hypothetical protein